MMPASTIFFIHINEIAFTKQDHNEVIHEQEICLPHNASGLSGTYFSGKKNSHVYHMK